jgi:hypothetical protein
VGEIRRLSEVSESARDAVGARRAPFPGRSRDQGVFCVTRTFRGRVRKRVATIASSAPDAFFLARGDSYLDAILSLNTAS